MNKKFFIGGVAGGFSYFVLSIIFYGFLLESTFAANGGAALNAMKEPLAFEWLAFGQFTFGFALAYIFVNWTSITGFSDGLKKGAIFGFFTSIGWDFTMYGTTNFMNMTGTFLDIIVYTVISALSGAIIAMVIKKV